MPESISARICTCCSECLSQTFPCLCDPCWKDPFDCCCNQCVCCAYCAKHREGCKHGDLWMCGCLFEAWMGDAFCCTHLAYAENMHKHLYKGDKDDKDVTIKIIPWCCNFCNLPCPCIDSMRQSDYCHFQRGTFWGTWCKMNYCDLCTCSNFGYRHVLMNESRRGKHYSAQKPLELTFWECSCDNNAEPWWLTTCFVCCMPCFCNYNRLEQIWETRELATPETLEQNINYLDKDWWPEGLAICFDCVTCTNKQNERSPCKKEICCHWCRDKDSRLCECLRISRNAREASARYNAVPNTENAAPPTVVTFSM